MQIREYSNLTDKDLHRPCFYTRWFCCRNKSCRTTLVMPERYKVRANASPAAKLADDEVRWLFFNGRWWREARGRAFRQ